MLYSLCVVAYWVTWSVGHLCCNTLHLILTIILDVKLIRNSESSCCNGMRKLKMWLAIRTPWVWMTSPSRRPYSPMAEFPNIVQILWIICSCPSNILVAREFSIRTLWVWMTSPSHRLAHNSRKSGMSKFSPMIMFVCFLLNQAAKNCFHKI